MSDWIDITHPIVHNMVTWPGDVPVTLERTSSISKGDGANVTVISLSAHTSTHMDAPLHFIDNEADISVLPLEKITGKAKVIEIKNKEQITAEELSEYQIEKGDKILFKTANSEINWPECNFLEKYVHITPKAATLLKEKQIDLVGIDYLSVGYGDDQTLVHQTILGNDIWIVEGLNLKGIKPGNYELVCLPLKLVGSDGSPARVIIRKLF